MDTDFNLKSAIENSKWNVPGFPIRSRVTFLRGNDLAGEAATTDDHLAFSYWQRATV
jgi:hypothetical protein